MLFKDKKMDVDYMPTKQIEMYLRSKLKKMFGHDYTVFVKHTVTDNWLGVIIDETTMTPAMHKDIMDFKKKYAIVSDLDVFSQVLKMQYGLDYDFKYLVDDSDGAYVIRRKITPPKPDEETAVSRDSKLSKNQKDDWSVKGVVEPDWDKQYVCGTEQYVCATDEREVLYRSR